MTSGENNWSIYRRCIYTGPIYHCSEMTIIANFDGISCDHWDVKAIFTATDVKISTAYQMATYRIFHTNYIFIISIAPYSYTTACRPRNSESMVASTRRNLFARTTTNGMPKLIK